MDIARVINLTMHELGTPICRICPAVRSHTAWCRDSRLTFVSQLGGTYNESIGDHKYLISEVEVAIILQKVLSERAGVRSTITK